MQSIYYGQLDLDCVLAIARNQKELVKTYKDKNDQEHHVLNISVLKKDEPDKFGNVASIKIDCNKDERREDLKHKYWCGSLKESTPREQPIQNPVSNDDYNDLGF